MSNFSDLPTETWFHVARYLRDPKLCELKFLNSFFLHCWMDRRWRKTVIDVGAPDRAVCILQRVADPFIATKVKALSICPQLIAYKGTPPVSKPPVETVGTAVAILLHTLPLLPNIISLHIYLFKNTVHLTTLFQTILCSAIPGTLQRLSLSGSLEQFSSIVEYFAHTTPFKNLTELTLFPGSDDLKLSSVILTPIVLSLAPNLQHLQVSHLLSSTDLSPLFDAICQPDSPSLFANLKSLILDIRHNPSFLVSRSFHRFLPTLSNDLHHLQFRHKTGIKWFLSDVEESLGEWLTELVNNCQFSSLQSLTISLPVSTMGLQAVLTLIKHVAPTLSSLAICDYFLPEKTAGLILDALTGSEVSAENENTNKEERNKLKSLSMEIFDLSIPLLELLASKLPQLEKLTLHIRRIIGLNENSFYQILVDRRYNREITSTPDILHAWKLRDLSITGGGSAERDAVRVVAGAVPGLAHLVGKGILNSIAFPDWTIIQMDSE